ncbi:MAG: sugar ABC transporter substrate-binding protein [Dehalococcoidia bacterium]|jgi:ribose transport system substrate-binding protein
MKLHRNKFIIALALLIVLPGILFAGCSDSTPAEPEPTTPAATEPTTPTEPEPPAEAEPIKAAYLTFALSSEVWQTLTNGAMALAPGMGIDLTIIDCAGNAATQVEQIESCVQAGYDVLIVSPVDREAVQECCREAIEAGVHIVSLDGTSFPCQVYCAADNYSDGYGLGVETAELVNETWPDKTEVNLCLLEYVYEAGCVDRAAGLMDGFNSAINATVNVVASLSPMNAIEATTMVESTLQAYDVDVCMSVSGDQMYGFCLAAEDAGIGYDDVICGAMDVTSASAQLLSEGKYIKLVGSWGDPFVVKPTVHLNAALAAYEIDGFVDDPVCVGFTCSYIDASGIEEIMIAYGWE